ncbi:MAG: hypothetical protein LJE75_06205 [Gammaproteobacteria bacterium]|jgi:hypothetical protein|nr:hypothetical protein [Gammaproteobacteria bacterium]
MFIHPVVRFTLCLAALLPLATQAEEEHWYNYDHLHFQAGTYIHYDPDEDHSGNRVFASLEAVKANDWFYGLALFNNSFNQFSQYLYGGKSWNLPGKMDDFNVKITAGLIHGYKGEFKDKIPNNDLGIAPAIIPGIGYRKGRFVAEMYALGIAGLLFTAGVDF